MKYSMNLTYDRSLSYKDRISALKSAGFTHAFLWWDQGDPLRFEQVRYMAAYGLETETAHLQFKGINNIWLDCPDGDELEKMFLASIDEAHEFAFPTVIMHLSSGYNPPAVSETGISRLKRICERAQKYGVAVAFENLRRTSYLDYVLDRLAYLDSVRFCFDCGHENLYNYGVGVLESHADRLSALHLHDNFGYADDHMLPFDARIDWRGMARRLKKYAAGLPITLEAVVEKPDRESYDRDTFLSLALEKAEKLYSLICES